MIIWMTRDCDRMMTIWCMAANNAFAICVVVARQNQYTIHSICDGYFNVVMLFQTKLV